MKLQVCEVSIKGVYSTRVHICKTLKEEFIYIQKIPVAWVICTQNDSTWGEKVCIFLLPLQEVWSVVTNTYKLCLFEKFIACYYDQAQHRDSCVSFLCVPMLFLKITPSTINKKRQLKK